MAEQKLVEDPDIFQTRDCKYCRKNFTTNRGLQVHMRSHQEQNSIPQTDGNISFSDVNETDKDDSSDKNKVNEFIEDDVIKKPIKQIKVKVATFTAGGASISVRENLRYMLEDKQEPIYLHDECAFDLEDKIDNKFTNIFVFKVNLPDQFEEIYEQDHGSWIYL